MPYTRTFIFHGLKRSGNHAVINWMRSVDLFPFHNNVLPFAHWAIHEGTLSRRILQRLRWREIRNGHYLPRNRLISLEDVPLGHEGFRAVPAKSMHIVLVRSAENLFASRIRKAPRGQDAYSTTPESIHRAVGLWTDHARELLNLSNFFSNKVGIYFDLWYKDGNYRQEIANRLGLSCDDAALSIQAREGNGSSFGATSEGVLSRRDILTAHERDLLDHILELGDLRSLNHELQALATGR